MEEDALWLFQRASPLGISCADCHPEAQAGPGLWNILGFRRTPSLAGGILDRAPYHSTAAFRTFESLLEEVLVHRMGADPVTDGEAAAFGAWLHGIPALRSTKRSPEQVTEGAQAFERAGCSKCHYGPQFTDGLRHRVRRDETYLWSL